MSLEARYRRLLLLYPHRHRAVYGEEMLGVLLAAAGPGRDRPSPGDRWDIARSALAVRLRGDAGGPGGTPWRRAAATVLVFGALLLAAVAVRLVAWCAAAPAAHWSTSSGALSVARAVIWALVAAAALARWRRSAAVGALAGLAAETWDVASFHWLAYQPGSAWRAAAAAAVAAAAGWLGTGAPAERPRAVGAGVLGAVALTAHGATLGWWIGPDRVALPVAVAVTALAAWCWWRQPPAVRVRMPLFGVPAAALVLVPLVLPDLDGPGGPAPSALDWIAWPVLLIGPVLALGATLLARGRRLAHLVRLGREAERGATAVEHARGG